MLNVQARPEAGVIANKSIQAQDQCFSADGSIIASGSGVCNGGWNDSPPDVCMEVYPAFRTSREVAGGGPEADIFKCHRRNIADAIAMGVYHGININGYRTELEQVFPDGLCDYSLGRCGIARKFLGVNA